MDKQVWPTLKHLILLWAFCSLPLMSSMGQNDVHRSMTHHWTFSEPFPYKDKKTGQEVKFMGDGQPSQSTDYLSLAGASCLILGSFTDPCLANMTACHPGYSLALWIQIKHTATSPQMLLGTSRNGTDIHGVFVYQTEAILTERRLIVEAYVNGLSWKVPVVVPQDIWVFITLTWNIKVDDSLTVYMNGDKVNSTVGKYGNDILLRRLLKLRGIFPGQDVPASLYLESGMLYDEVMTWSRSLTEPEAKRLFQSQLNELLKINCTATVTTLNITWQTINRNIFSKSSEGYAVRVSRNKQLIAMKDINSASNHYFLRHLVPYASYKVRLWRNTEQGRKRIGALLCRTKEGVPTEVQNLRITAQNSTSLLVQWSPPAQINGILLGYNLTVEYSDLHRVITVKDTPKYLVTDLKPDSDYAIEVQSYTAAGSSSRTVYKIAKTNKVPAVTEMPRNLSAFAVRWDALQVTWTPLDHSEEVTSYDVEYCSVSECRAVAVVGSSVVFDGLPQHTSFTVKVRGRNTGYAGPWKIASEVKTLDLNECKTDKHRCSAHALCANTEGSYACFCKAGFTGDGFWCEVMAVPSKSSQGEFCEAELLKNISWIRTAKGETVKKPCPFGFSGEASRSCSAVGKVSWEKPDLTKCVSRRLMELKSKIASQAIDLDSAVSLASDLLRITDFTRDDLVLSGDLYTAVDILQALEQKTTKNTTTNKEKANQLMTNVVGVASNLLDGRNVMDAWQDSSVASRSSCATKLLISMESLALLTASVSKSTNITSMETSNVVVKFISLERDNFMPESVSFATSDNGLGNRIEMPTSEMYKEYANSSEETKHIAFIYMDSIGQLMTNTASRNNKGERIKSDSDATVNSGVISLSTSPKTSRNFEKPVVIILQNNQSEKNLQPLCVFWKISRDAGSWSRGGCHVNFANSTHTVCHCYHLTSFSVLMQYTPESFSIKGSHELALSLITYIGISISLVALVIALITFCSLTFLRSNRNFAHINLVFSLILAELLFVVGVDKIQYQTACFVIAVFLHYLFLVAFCWMATEGVILYLMLVKVFPTSSEGPKKKLLFICSWGIPTIPVASTILINQQGYTTDKHCWLSVEDGFIWSFVGPVVLICVVNLVFLGMTFKTMANRSSKQLARKPPQMRYWVKACAVLTCLLGTTWLLGLFILGKSSVVMAYLFNIFNVFQGLFIFIFHCLADERIRSEYKRIICCHGSRREYLRNKTVVKSEHHNKCSQDTFTSRIIEKKSKSEDSSEKRLSVCDDTTVALIRDSSGIVFAEQGPVKSIDRYLEITPLTVTTEQDEEGSEVMHPLESQHQHSYTSGLDELGNHDDEKSVDVFFEDISCSLIDIRKNRTTSSASHCSSIISNSFQDI